VGAGRITVSSLRQEFVGLLIRVEERSENLPSLTPHPSARQSFNCPIFPTASVSDSQAPWKSSVRNQFGQEAIVSGGPIDVVIAAEASRRTLKILKH
jgi:hypothetical protein